MAKSFKEQFTNWLIAIVGFAGALWVNTVINNQSKILEKLDTLSVMMATANSERGTLKEQMLKVIEKDEKQDEIINTLKRSTSRLFKHEQYITLNKE